MQLRRAARQEREQLVVGRPQHLLERQAAGEIVHEAWEPLDVESCMQLAAPDVTVDE